jgi:CheY-like chemotaxis protein
MKILIVDDNIAIQEILSEILTVDGNEIEVAGSFDDVLAKEGSFKPELIILDSILEGDNGLKILDMIPANPDLRVLVLTANKDKLPKDTPYICGYVQKPFKSSEILAKVREVSDSIDAKKNKNKTKRFRFRLFSKPEPAKVENDIGVRFGKSYVIYEDEPEAVYKVAGSLLSKGNDLLIVTSSRVKSVTERFRDGNVRVLGMSVKPTMGYVGISKLGTLMGEITQFTDAVEHPVVVIDSLEQLISANGLNAILTMLYQIVNNGSNKASTLVVSVKESILTDKDKELFQHYMEVYTDH